MLDIIRDITPRLKYLIGGTGCLWLSASFSVLAYMAAMRESGFCS